jgi:hypothetical protein
MMKLSQPVFDAHLTQIFFSIMTEGGVAKIVAEGNRFDKIEIEIQ